MDWNNFYQMFRSMFTMKKNRKKLNYSKSQRRSSSWKQQRKRQSLNNDQQAGQLTPCEVSDSELHDEVFVDEEPTSSRPSILMGTSDDKQEDCYPSRDNTTQTPYSQPSQTSRSTVPSITLDGPDPHVAPQSMRRHRNMSGTPSVTLSLPECVGRNSSVRETLFHNSRNSHDQLENTSEDHSTAVSDFRSRKRGRHHRKKQIQVKYTKVYGEDDGAYKNDSDPRGLVFMCNFSSFQDNKYSERVGSEIDYENMQSLFHQMGYGVFLRKKRYCMEGFITKKEFMARLNTFSKDPKHLVLCSCVVILMSHGSSRKTFITSDNKEVDLMEVYSIFDNIHCKVLRGKPKIFVLQFCRSDGNEPAQTNPIPRQMNQDLLMVIRDEVWRAVQHQQRRQQQLDDNDPPSCLDPQSPFLLAIEEQSLRASISSLNSFGRYNSQIFDDSDLTPSSKSPGYKGSEKYQVDTRHVPTPPQEGVQRYSDMYSIFSTSPGELSHRDPHKGSLLIQAICHVFAENAYHDEIDTLVRKVSTYMRKTLQKDDPITVPRQTCERTNNGLDKYFYFNPHEVHDCRLVTM